MKIDNVYVASVFVAINSVHENKDNEASLKISFKLLLLSICVIIIGTSFVGCNKNYSE